jgi:hypothetical protein
MLGVVFFVALPDGGLGPQSVHAQGKKKHAKKNKRKNRGNKKPRAPRREYRGELEIHRDYELHKHFRRIAQLDVIAEIAQKQGDLKMRDRVEKIRRSEDQRFRYTMQRLRAISRARIFSGDL